MQNRVFLFLEEVDIQGFRGYSGFSKKHVLQAAELISVSCGGHLLLVTPQLHSSSSSSQIEFFWFPHLPKIATGKPETARFRRSPQKPTNSIKHLLAAPHSVFQTARCPSNFLLLPQLFLIIISLSFMC